MCIKCERHVFNIQFFILFKEKSSNNIIFDVCDCKWEYKSASTSMNGGTESQNHINKYGDFSFMGTVRVLKSLLLGFWILNIWGSD